MSDSDSDLLATLIQQTSDNLVQRYILIASLALILYDTLLKFPEEVTYIWRGRLHIVTFLYVLTQYTLILFLSFDTLISFLPIVTLSTCNHIVPFLNVLAILDLVGLHGLLLARTYAIAEQNKRVLIGLGALSFLVIASGTIQLAKGSCESRTPVAYVFAETAFFIAFDTAVIIVTVYYTWRVIIFQDSSSEAKSLRKLLAQQALLRYIVIVSWAIAGLVRSVPGVIRPSIIGVDTALENAVSTIFICRFIVDVRHYGGRTIHNGSGGNTRGTEDITTLPRFQAAIRNLDAAISEGLGDPDDEGFRLRGIHGDGEELVA